MKKQSAIHDKQFIINFILLFLAVHILGLFVAHKYSLLDLQLSVFGDPNSIYNALFIVGYILFLTLIQIKII